MQQVVNYYILNNELKRLKNPHHLIQENRSARKVLNEYNYYACGIYCVELYMGVKLCHNPQYVMIKPFYDIVGATLNKEYNYYEIDLNRSEYITILRTMPRNIKSAITAFPPPLQIFYDENNNRFIYTRAFKFCYQSKIVPAMNLRPMTISNLVDIGYFYPDEVCTHFPLRSFVYLFCTDDPAYKFMHIYSWKDAWEVYYTRECTETDLLFVQKKNSADYHRYANTLRHTFESEHLIREKYTLPASKKSHARVMWLLKMRCGRDVARLIFFHAFPQYSKYRDYYGFGCPNIADIIVKSNHKYIIALIRHGRYYLVSNYKIYNIGVSRIETLCDGRFLTEFDRPDIMYNYLINSKN